MALRIEILPNRTDLIRHARSRLLDRLQSAAQTQSIVTLALSGGSTPKPLYESLIESDLPWHKLHIFWGDERYVPNDHPDSNEKMTREVWLNHSPIPPENIHPVPTDLPTPIAAAEAYEQTLRKVFDLPDSTGSPVIFPSFDVILLGMGDDAHTASLFPHTEALQVCDRLVTCGEKAGQPRITFTVPLINQAQSVLFLLAGESKQAALSQVFAPVAEADQYPSRLIQPMQECLWMMDLAAGQGIVEKENAVVLSP